MKIMFLDESGDHSLEKIDQSYPMFVLAGCIFDFNYYFETVEKAVNELKQTYFGRTDIILRSYDIRKQKGDFVSLINREKRGQFYLALDNLISSMQITVIAAAIEKNRLKRQYTSPDNPYHLCFQFILERTIMFLGSTVEKMMFRIESRESHNDQKLAKVYEDFKSKNHRYISTSEAKRKLIDLAFNQKTQNIAGMQIADLIAYPIGKWVLDKSKENKAFDIIKFKFHKKPKTDTFLNCGLKVFP